MARQEAAPGVATFPPDISPQHCAQCCGISLRTARRWKAAGQMPMVYALALALLREGDLGALSPAWRGWKLYRDQIFDPAGNGYRPGEIMAIPLRQQLESELRRRLAEPQQYALLAP